MNQRRLLTSGPQPFEFKPNESSCAMKWHAWIRGFEVFLKANQIENDGEKHSLLLHYAGIKVQEVYFNLPQANSNTNEENQFGPWAGGYGEQSTSLYSETIAKLQEFFAPKRSSTYEKNVLRQMKQLPGERIDVFVMRVRAQAEMCDYPNLDALETSIKEQIGLGCHSSHLRRKVLEHGDNCSLDDIMKKARVIETVNEEQKLFDGAQSQNKEEKSSSEVCKIYNNPLKRKFGSTNNKFDRTDDNNECSRCGFKGHKSSDDSCPAKGKTCNSCKGKDHYARKCFSGNNKRKWKPESQSNVKTEKSSSGQEAVQLVQDDDKDTDWYDDVFCIFTNEANEMWCQIGGVDMKVIVDSGSKYNLVDRESWIDLKTKNVVTIERKKETDKQFRAYGGKELKLLGVFKAEIKVADKIEIAEFYVVDESGKILLGRETAIALKILKIGHDVNQIDEQFAKIKGVMVDIPINQDVTPVSQMYRRVPAPLEREVDEKIEKMLKQDIIEKVDSSKWVSPLVVVPKQDDIRICVDMRRANEAIVRENYPLPTIETFLPHLTNAKVFSKIDISQAFHQVEIAPASRVITTFITRKGLFRYKRLMFGITCAPEIFQKILEQILNGCDGCLNFIDDILVHGSDQAEHDTRLKIVLQRLAKFTVVRNDDKCIYGVPELDFLGHHLSANGITPTFDKVAAVKQFRAPKTAEEVRSFLGLVNYVSRFLPDLATVTEPLRQLTRKEVRFEWKEIHQKAFNSLKDAISNETTLGYYSVTDRTQLIVDASPVGLGGVLVQFQPNEPRVIAYASRSLTDIEQRYCQTEKEALALVWGVERFHYYLYGREFELVTDHKPLEVIFGTKSKPCARIERWVLRLQSYRYKVVYKSGKSNIADPLSRLVVDAPVEAECTKEAEEYVNFVTMYAEPKAIKLSEIQEESLADSSVTAVIEALHENNWSDGKVAAYKNFANELCVAGDILLRGTRIVMPEKLQNRALELAHEGHPGMSVMKRRLRAKIWYPKMDDQIELFVRKCPGCTLVSAPSAPEPMMRTKLPSEPWQHVALDFKGPLPSGHNLLVVVDYFSRFSEVEIMTKIGATETIERLEVMFARFGNPISITCDNGSQLICTEFRKFCENNGIKLIHVTPYWPQQNGEVERQNRSLTKVLTISQEAKSDWKRDLYKYLLMYRSTPHSTTLESPAKLMFGRNIRDKLPSIEQPLDADEAVKDRDLERKQKGKEYGDEIRHAKPNDIEEGDKVVIKRTVLSNKLQAKYEPTIYVVLKRMGSEVTVKSTETSKEYKRNVAHVKKIYFDDSDNEASEESESEQLKTASSSITGTSEQSEQQKRPAAAVEDNDPLPAKRIRNKPNRYQS